MKNKNALRYAARQRITGNGINSKRGRTENKEINLILYNVASGMTGRRGLSANAIHATLLLGLYYVEKICHFYHDIPEV